jgi:hypothetical protein
MFFINHILQEGNEVALFVPSNLHHFIGHYPTVYRQEKGVCVPLGKIKKTHHPKDSEGRFGNYAYKNEKGSKPAWLSCFRAFMIFVLKSS